MKMLTLADGVSATAVAAQTSKRSRTTPFLTGRKGVATISFTGATGTPTGKIQGSHDDSTWVDLLVNSTLGEKRAEITLYEYMRFNQTAAGTAGTVSADVIASP